MFFLAAVGVDWAWRSVNGLLKGKTEKRFFQQKRLLPIGMGTIFAACLIPALAGYYASDKGSAREISQMVRMTWEQNTPIYIMPGNELNLFQYYLIDAPDVPLSSETLIPTDWGSISDLSSQEQERAIIITGEMAPNGYQQILLQEDYQKIYASKQSVRFPHEVWVKGVSGQ
jgi:hypothetical protein